MLNFLRQYVVVILNRLVVTTVVNITERVFQYLLLGQPKHGERFIYFGPDIM